MTPIIFMGPYVDDIYLVIYDNNLLLIINNYLSWSQFLK